MGTIWISCVVNNAQDLFYIENNRLLKLLECFEHKDKYAQNYNSTISPVFESIKGLYETAYILLDALSGAAESYGDSA